MPNAEGMFVLGISMAVASLSHMFWSVNIVLGAFPFMNPKKVYHKRIKNIKIEGEAYKRVKKIIGNST